MVPTRESPMCLDFPDPESITRQPLRDSLSCRLTAMSMLDAFAGLTGRARPYTKWERKKSITPSTGLPQNVLNCLRVLGDDCQQHSRRPIRAGPPLFPVAQCCWRNAEPGSELRLAQFEATANGANVDSRHLDSRNAHWHVLSARPSDSLIQPAYDPLTRRESTPAPCRLFRLGTGLLHLVLLCCSVRINSGILFFIAFRSAFVKLAFTFFAYISSITAGRPSLW